METITFRDEDDTCLSNYKHRCILIDGIKYPTAEHAFQALRCFDIQDHNKIIET